MSNDFKVLKVKETASKEEIKKAYHLLVNKYHPDNNPGNSEAEKKLKKLMKLTKI